MAYYYGEKSHTVRNLIAVGAIAGAAILLVKNSFTDGDGDRNLSLGSVHAGNCANLLADREIRNPATDYKLKTTIQDIARVCGFCDDSQSLERESISYRICIDPEAIELRQNADGHYTVTSYLTTDPAGAPEDLIYTALSTNPGVCEGILENLSGSMVDTFSRAFEPATAGQLVPDIHVAPGSQGACDAPSPGTSQP